AILDGRVLTVDVAGLLQTLAERGHVRCIPVRRCAVEETDHRHCRLLRARRERPRRSAAEKRDERAPFHPITSSILEPRRHLPWLFQTSCSRWFRQSASG